MTADDATGGEHVDDRRARARKAVGRSLGIKLLIYLLVFVVLFVVVAVEVLCGRCAGPVSSARPRTTGSRHARRHRAPAHGLLGIRPAWRATFTRSMPFTSVCGGRCG